VQLRKSLATQVIWMSVLPLVFIPQVIRGAGFMAAGVLVMVIGAMYVVRDFRRAGRFLDRATSSAPIGQP
jgi:hypothetical protein